MLDRADGALPVRRQCALLSAARSGVHRARKPANDNDGVLMRGIDELFTASLSARVGLRCCALRACS
jgi:putative transposase